ncbi:MAG: helix-turn-helix domain-containing protein, partial [Oscillospiraceae bacterium]|nr:helix-turn-helix domain-containing protein [Oscillospiraceae bacterium]
MDTVRIGKFLSELRHERELTQEQLGERIGVSNKTVSRWENGNYMPPVEMLMELSNFFGVSINEILSGRRLDDTETKSAAEENLKSVLEESPVDFKQRTTPQTMRKVGLTVVG